MAGGTRQANFTLPKDLLEELKSAVPKGTHSKVVSRALHNELTRLRFMKALETSFGAWTIAAHPELAQGTKRFIRSLRKSTRLRTRASR